MAAARADMEQPSTEQPRKEEPRSLPHAKASHPARRRSCRGAQHDRCRAGRFGPRGDRSGQRCRCAAVAEKRRLRLRSDDQRLCDAPSIWHGIPAGGAVNFCPDVPALIITGYAEADAISDRPEGVEILLKPFTPTKLEAALAKSLRCGACGALTTVRLAKRAETETATSCETPSSPTGFRSVQ